MEKHDFIDIAILFNYQLLYDKYDKIITIITIYLIINNDFIIHFFVLIIHV